MLIRGERDRKRILEGIQYLSANVESDHRYNDKKFSGLERRIHDLEERINN